MDALTASLDAHCDVAANPFDTNRPHPRYLETYVELRERVPTKGDQAERRKKLLERQKSKRESLVNLHRIGLEESKQEVAQESVGKCMKEPVKESVEEQMEESKYSELSSESGQRPSRPSRSAKSHEFANIPSSVTAGSKWTFKDQLMMLEWLVDVPSDLVENWVVKPCPKGRRMLVVAHQGWTKAYSKAGHLVATFKSALPCGNHSTSRCITILDCIWNYHNRTYYVLDVLAWNNIVLLDCETEFRFYWLKVKLDEIPEVGSHSEANNFAFVALPYIECREEYLTELMNSYPLFSEGTDPELDGILFYHKSNLYEHGSTPLVSWIKPFMMEDVLGIKVHENYAKGRPACYLDQAAYIRNFEQNAQDRKDFFRNRGSRRRAAQRNQESLKMDTCENAEPVNQS